MPAFHFDPTTYGPTVAGLLAERLTELGPGSPNAAVRDRLRSFDPMKDLGPVADADMARACHAGLWLYHDFLDESHTISQEIETPTGSFWHAIMHRREPDAWNSKYWWRRVGSHPVLGLLREHAPVVGYAFTTPEAFVDLCERVRGSGSDGEELAKRVQLLEWQLLFDWCYRHAVRS
ncbi:MAG TPA: hypothetical protein VKE74_12640 [Gemmataceae bacterium]|nr:hypothetical protein [Gemmataceae bacterium]